MKSTRVGYNLSEEFAGYLLVTLLRAPRRRHALAELWAGYRGGAQSFSSAEQIVAKLQRAGVPLHGIRGPGGGYKAGPGLGAVTMLAVKQALGYAPTQPESAWACAKNKALLQVTLADLAGVDESAPPV